MNELQGFPPACPKWQLRRDPKNGDGVEGYSWLSPEEELGTHVIFKIAMRDIQSNKTIGVSREDAVCSTFILPCVVEASPTVAACMGSKQIFSRYTTSITTCIMLHDLRLYFDWIICEHIKKGQTHENITQHRALKEQISKLDAEVDQWRRFVAREAKTKAFPLEWTPFMEQATLLYIHIQERAMMAMLWIMSNRDPQDVVSNTSIGRFLTRDIVYPDAQAAFALPVDAYSKHVCSMIQFFDVKQSIVNATCAENSAFKKETNQFFPARQVQEARAPAYAKFIPAETMAEYFHYMQSNIALLNLL